MALLTLRQTAARLNVHWKTVYMLIRRGALEAERAGIGRRAQYRIDEAAIARYRRSRAVAAPTQPEPVDDGGEVYDETFH